MVVNLDLLINVGVLLGVVVVYFGFRYFTQAIVNLISPNTKIPSDYVIVKDKYLEEDMTYGRSDAYLRAKVLKR